MAPFSIFTVVPSMWLRTLVDIAKPLRSLFDGGPHDVVAVRQASLTNKLSHGILKHQVPMAICEIFGWVRVIFLSIDFICTV